MNNQDNFRELLELIKSTRPEYVEGLGKGYSRAEIESAIKIHPIPEALIDIYLCIDGGYWHDDGFTFIPAYGVLPISAIQPWIETSQDIYAGYDRLDDKHWQPDMIPFLHDGAGYSICVRTLPNDNSVWVIPKFSDSYKLNTSLDKFIFTAIECYRQGAYYLDPDDDIWDTDWELSREIASKIDPEIEKYEAP
jgi:SMI1 / KNR4 family (SUKH-1)